MVIEVEKLVGLTKEKAIIELKRDGNEYTILQEDEKVYSLPNFISSRFNLIIYAGRVRKVLMG